MVTPFMSEIHYQRNKSKVQFEHILNLMQTFENLLLQDLNFEIFYSSIRITDVCSSGGATCIIS